MKTKDLMTLKELSEVVGPRFELKKSEFRTHTPLTFMLYFLLISKKQIQKKLRAQRNDFLNVILRVLWLFKFLISYSFGIGSMKWSPCLNRPPNTLDIPIFQYYFL